MNVLTVAGLSHLKDLVLDNQVSSISMESHEEIISKLKFIGHIEKDEKINVRHVVRQPDSLYTKLSRRIIYPDNRLNTLKFIRDVLIRSFEIIDYHLTHKNILTCRGIVGDLIKCKQGIVNLKHTYNNDTKFCCDMDVLIELNVSKLASLRIQHPELFEESDPREPRENKDKGMNKK